MKLVGRIIAIHPVVEGKSDKGEWRRQEIILETMTDFPKKVCISFGNPDMLQGFSKNEIVEVAISPESKDYNGKWFTTIRGISIKTLMAGK